MTIGGVWSAIVNLAIFKWALDVGKSMVEAQCLCFLCLVVIQFFKAYNFRSDRKSIFEIGLFKNKWLNLAILWEAALLYIVIEVPFLEEVFNTYPLSVFEWLAVILLAASIFPILEISKAVIRWQERKALLQMAS